MTDLICDDCGVELVRINHLNHAWRCPECGAGPYTIRV